MIPIQVIGVPNGILPLVSKERDSKGEPVTRRIKTLIVTIRQIKKYIFVLLIIRGVFTVIDLLFDQTLNHLRKVSMLKGMHFLGDILWSVCRIYGCGCLKDDFSVVVVFIDQMNRDTC